VNIRERSIERSRTHVHQSAYGLSRKNRLNHPMCLTSSFRRSWPAKNEDRD